MIESWLRAAERTAHLVSVSDAKTIGILSIDGDAGVSTFSRMVCQVSGGKSEALLVNLASPLRDSAEATDEPQAGAFIWERMKADDGCSAMVAKPTAGTRFLYNDVSSLRQAWTDELHSYSKLVLDLPPVFHGRSDLLDPLAAAASCDTVFLVCVQDRTVRWRLAEAMALLRAARVNIAGVIVNEKDSTTDEEVAEDWTPVAADHDPPASAIVRRFVRAAWRRRYLVLVPILVMLPLSVVAAKLLPVPYVSTALLLLQEPGIEGPSGTAFAVSERIEERVAGLESLLKSHRVLSTALTDLRKAGLAPQEPAGAVEDLQGRLSLKLVGLDMLQIDLKGNMQHGLGRQLEEVVTRFLEALTTDQGAMTAGQLLVRDRRTAWQAAQQAYAATLVRLADIFPDGLENSSAQLTSLEARLEGTRSELATIDAELKRSAGRRQETASPEIQAKKDQLVKYIAQLETETQHLKDLIEEHYRLEAQTPRLEAEIASAQRQYASLAQQYDSGAADFPQRLLDAPERIRIIDSPGDPQAPETSRLLYVLFGVAASVVLGVGLAWAAEQADPSLRDRHEFSAVAGVPVVARLPRFTAAGDGVSKERRSPRLRLLVLSVLFVLVVLSLFWLRLAPAETTAAITRWEFVTRIGSWMMGVTGPASTLLEPLLSPFRR